jgi:hypothetical protein
VESLNRKFWNQEFEMPKGRGPDALVGARELKFVPGVMPYWVEC